MTREQLASLCNTGPSDDPSLRMCAWSGAAAMLRDERLYRETRRFLAMADGNTPMDQPGNRYHGEYLAPAYRNELTLKCAAYEAAVVFLPDGDREDASKADIIDAITAAITECESSLTMR